MLEPPDTAEKPLEHGIMSSKVDIWLLVVLYNIFASVTTFFNTLTSFNYSS